MYWNMSDFPLLKNQSCIIPCILILVFDLASYLGPPTLENIGGSGYEVSSIYVLVYLKLKVVMLCIEDNSLVSLVVGFLSSS
jgi:hypothetical protein